MSMRVLNGAERSESKGVTTEQDMQIVQLPQEVAQQPPTQTTRSLRVLYAAGPGNVLGTYQNWLNGQDDVSQVAVTYSSQFFDACRKLNAQGYVISSCAEKGVLQDEQFKIEHRPHPTQYMSGVRYHLGQIWYGLRLAASALRWRADVAVVADGTTHWFVLWALPHLGIKLVPSLHCVLWSKYLTRRPLEKLISSFNRYTFANSLRILAVSNDIAQQVRQLTSVHPPIQEFLPLYRRGEFHDVKPPSADRSVFRVLFIGRIEVNKGVFNLLDIAKRFAAEGRQIHFDLCGTGSALHALQQAAIEAKLETSFVCHGYCNKPQIRKRLGESHVVISPTTTAFVEGFCKVVAEGILAGRPVITSTVCPALSYVQPAVVEVKPNDINGYGDALLKLCDDSEFYEMKRRACLEVQDQFYNWSFSWETALQSTLLAAQAAKTQSKSAALKNAPSSVQQ
jgi:glycosyltransferase involved in cell wall biosynthesis